MPTRRLFKMEIIGFFEVKIRLVNICFEQHKINGNCQNNLLDQCLKTIRQEMEIYSVFFHDHSVSTFCSIMSSSFHLETVSHKDPELKSFSPMSMNSAKHFGSQMSINSSLTPEEDKSIVSSSENRKPFASCSRRF